MTGVQTCALPICCDQGRSEASVVVRDALGICEANFVNWYLSQIIDVAKPGARADEQATNAMLAGIAAMRPRDEAEAMLIAQMIATHELAMTFARRLKRIENIPQQDSAVNGLTKLTRTYAARWRLSSATAQAASRR